MHTITLKCLLLMHTSTLKRLLIMHTTTLKKSLKEFLLLYICPNNVFFFSFDFTFSLPLLAKNVFPDNDACTIISSAIKAINSLYCSRKTPFFAHLLPTL